jgi:Ca-activated chloride channel homolog
MSLSFHAPTYAWLGALAAPVVIFYFLKLKRPRHELPSLVLWRQVMNDQRVNSPFQRFKRNILLWLQLAVLLALVLAATQPFLAGGTDRADRLPILIDVSASMGARTSSGGPTRLDEAKKIVNGMIDNLGSGQEIALITFGAEAHRVTGFSNDSRELSRALDDVKVEDVRSDPATAFQLAQAMGRESPFDRALLVSDGNLADAIDADLAFTLDYQRVAPGGANLGITAFSAARRDDGRWDVFVAVDSSAESDGTATLELVQGEDTIGSRPLSPAPLTSERVAFRVDGSDQVLLEARLKCDAFDAISSDDHAYLVLPRISPVRAFVAPTLPSWRRALAAQPAVTFVDKPSAGSAIDLLISDKSADLDRDAILRIAVGLRPPELAGDIVHRGDGGSTVVDYRKTDPVLNHVMLDDLLINDQVTWNPGIGESDLEAHGFNVLVHGDRGPLVVLRRRTLGADYYFMFHSDRSTLPYRLGFPILAGNLVAQAQRLRGEHDLTSMRTGVVPAFPAAPSIDLSVDGPTAEKELKADPEGMVAGLLAAHPGFYQVKGAGFERVFGVSLLDSRETRLGSIEKLQIHEVAVAATDKAAPSERALWHALALIAFAIALCEWWYGHRRPRARRAVQEAA